jgi:hypothetical protein
MPYIYVVELAGFIRKAPFDARDRGYLGQQANAEVSDPSIIASVKSGPGPTKVLVKVAAVVHPDGQIAGLSGKSHQPLITKPTTKRPTVV